VDLRTSAVGTESEMPATSWPSDKKLEET
jgi:hypothetical protein